jgi:hypothetical protein
MHLACDNVAFPETAEWLLLPQAVYSRGESPMAAAAAAPAPVTRAIFGWVRKWHWDACDGG